MSSKILTISALSSQGEGISKDASKVYFVRGALPGQTVLARIVQEKERYVFAEKEDLLEDICKDRKYICPHRECGGCPLQGISLEEEEEHKKNYILTEFRKIAKISDLNIDIISLSNVQYRNKMEFSFGYDKEGKKTVGLYKAKSSIIVPVTNCALVPSFFMEILSIIREYLQYSLLPVWNNKKGFWRYIVLRYSVEKNKFLLHCITGPSSSAGKKEVEKLSYLFQQFSNLSFIHSERKSAYDVAFGEKILFQNKESFLEEALTIDDKKHHFLYGVNSFFQVNTEMTSLLFQEASSHIVHGSRLLDLCCGVGSIGVSCSAKLTEIYGIDTMECSIKYAKKNAQNNTSITTKYCVKSIKDLTIREIEKYTCICVDPPRGGLYKETISLLCKAKIPMLIYISCNPSTLARDVEALQDIYEIKKAKAFNMFRFSPHVEAMIVFVLRE